MPGIINGRSWLHERKRFLLDELAKEPAAEQRAAIEAELSTVDQELSTQRQHWWRWLAWGARPPQ